MRTFRVLFATGRKGLAARSRAIGEASDAEHRETKTEMLVASSLQEAKEILDREVVDLAIVDLLMGARRGIELVLAIRHAFPTLFLVAVTDMQLRDFDREAIKLGVDGFLVHPVTSEHLYFQIARFRELSRLRHENARLKAQVAHAAVIPDIIGAGSEMREIQQLITRAAETSVPVAVYGESGTGKELVARAVHRHSRRNAGPFISINPASIPESLLEAELFGHVRGAFTGASDRVGFIESAGSGTLFLDEIGELPMSLQVKLLRVLQEKVIYRVGSSKPIRVDFRLVTATNRDLLAEAKAGRFREDLFYRIHVFPIYLPPLRSRRRDISQLADHFLKLYARESGRPLSGFSPQSLEILETYDWPGNVRELENYVQRIVALKSRGSIIEVDDLVGLREPARSSQASPRSLDPQMNEVRPLAEHVRRYVRWAYESLGRNKARTARMLEIDRVTLYRRLNESEDST
jgi:two-component system response regulator HydG